MMHTIVGIAAAILIGAVLCSFGHGTTDPDWTPRSWSAFRRPQCPLCWAGRVALVVLVVLLAAEFWS